jgi:hypothetical protein
MQTDAPERAAGRPSKTPAKVITKRATLADAELRGNRSHVGGRLILFKCSECGHEVRKEHNFSPTNLLPEKPNERAFLIERVSRGIRDAQAEREARIRRLMVSDHVRKYRDKFAKDGANA